MGRMPSQALSTSLPKKEATSLSEYMPTRVPAHTIPTRKWWLFAVQQQPTLTTWNIHISSRKVSPPLTTLQAGETLTKTDLISISCSHHSRIVFQTHYFGRYR